MEQNFYYTDPSGEAKAACAGRTLINSHILGHRQLLDTWANQAVPRYSEEYLWQPRSSMILEEEMLTSTLNTHDAVVC